MLHTPLPCCLRMIPIARHLQRRRISKLFTMKIPVPDLKDAADDVWGFMSKAKADELIKSHRMLASMIQKSYVGPIKEQLDARGFDQDEFKEGCKIAYQRIADIYKQGEPVFKEKHLDIVEEQVADDLDEQLQRYKSKSLKPRLTTESIDARLLFLIRSRKETFEGPIFVRLFNAFMSMSVQDFRPKYELLAAVEFKVWEKFDLVETKVEGAKVEPSKTESVNTTEEPRKTDETTEKAAETDKTSSEAKANDDTISRKHMFVFAADLPAGEIPKATEADVVEFKVRSIGRAFGM